MHIQEDVFLSDYGLRRKKFTYDKRIHHSYVFGAGNEIYTVIVGNLADEQVFSHIGYRMPGNITFPGNGMAEVCFDTFDGIASLSDFRHVRFRGLGSAVVLQTVTLALIATMRKLT